MKVIKLMVHMARLFGLLSEITMRFAVLQIRRKFKKETFEGV